MIRPITVICWILALGAGLYLYRAKHEVELMDKHIEQVAKETSDVRADSRRLLDDWLRLGEPEQLHKYSDEYLGLKTIAPTQFARLSDLPSRLPEPRADPPDQDTTPVAELPDAPPPGDAIATGATASGPAAAGTDATDEPGADDLPVPPIPPPVPVLTTVVFPAVATVPLQARPVTPLVAAAPSQPRPAESHIADEPLVAPRTSEPETLAEPRQADAIRPASPSAGQPGPRDRGLPPLQAQTGQPSTGQGQRPRRGRRGRNKVRRPGLSDARNQDEQPQQPPIRTWRTQAWQNKGGQYGGGQYKVGQDRGGQDRGGPDLGDQARAEAPSPSPGLEARQTPPRRQPPEQGLPPLQAQRPVPAQGSGQPDAGPGYTGQAYREPVNSGPAGSGPRYAGRHTPASRLAGRSPGRHPRASLKPGPATRACGRRHRGSAIRVGHR